MFNRKLVSFLTEQLAFQKKENDRLLNIIRTDLFRLTNEVNKINHKLSDQHPEHHTPPGTQRPAH